MFKPQHIKTKSVNYFGIEVSVPETAKYLATNSSGDINWYEIEPTKSTFWWGVPFADNFGEIMTLKYVGDWKDSLMGV